MGDLPVLRWLPELLANGYIDMIGHGKGSDHYRAQCKEQSVYFNNDLRKTLKGELHSFKLSRVIDSLTYRYNKGYIKLDPDVQNKIIKLIEISAVEHEECIKSINEKWTGKSSVPSHVSQMLIEEKIGAQNCRYILHEIELIKRRNQLEMERRKNQPSVFDRIIKIIDEFIGG